MKKFILMLALLIQTTVLVFAANEPVMIARASTDNVKMYQQPGTSTAVIRSLKTTDNVVVVRKYNHSWSIITVNEEVGYVLTSELAFQKEVKNIAMAKLSRVK
jgi:uncharacterized protein YgiM (DUF1202 family)